MVRPAAALLSKIRLETRKKLNTEFTGRYRSAFKGNGLLFENVREYEYGDDIKNIDWNVSARMDKLFVKQFIEERELNIVLMVDISASMIFGGTRTKRDVLLEAATLFLYLAQYNNDSISVLLFSDRVESFFRPKKGRKFVLKVLNDILSHKPSSVKTNIGAAVEFVEKSVKKRSTVLVLSDFLDDNYFLKLKRLKRKHDIIPVRIFDPLEENFRFYGLTEFYDMETGEVIFTDGMNSEKNSDAIMGLDVINLSTDEKIEDSIIKFFKQRARKISR